MNWILFQQPHGGFLLLSYQLSWGVTSVFGQSAILGDYDLYMCLGEYTTKRFFTHFITKWLNLKRNIHGICGWFQSLKGMFCCLKMYLAKQQITQVQSIPNSDNGSRFWGLLHPSPRCPFPQGNWTIVCPHKYPRCSLKKTKSGLWCGIKFTWKDLSAKKPTASHVWYLKHLLVAPVEEVVTFTPTIHNNLYHGNIFSLIWLTRQLSTQAKLVAGRCKFTGFYHQTYPSW